MLSPLAVTWAVGGKSTGCFSNSCFNRRKRGTWAQNTGSTTNTFLIPLKFCRTGSQYSSRNMKSFPAASFTLIKIVIYKFIVIFCFWYFIMLMYNYTSIDQLDMKTQSLLGPLSCFKWKNKAPSAKPSPARMIVILWALKGLTPKSMINAPMCLYCIRSGHMSLVHWALFSLSKSTLHTFRALYLWLLGYVCCVFSVGWMRGALTSLLWKERWISSGKLITAEG